MPAQLSVMNRSKWPAALPVFPPGRDSCAAQPNPALGSQHPCPYTASQPDPDPQYHCHFWPWLKFWRIFLTQQDLEKSHSLCEWFPKHWALLAAAGPSAGCLHPCGLGASTHAGWVPRTELAVLNPCVACTSGTPFLKKQYQNAPRQKNVYVNRETKACLWRFMPQVVHSYFMLVFSLPYLGKRKKSLEMCTSHKQASKRQKNSECFHSLAIPRNSYETRGKRTVPAYTPWFFKWGLLLKMALKMRSPQCDGRHYCQSRSIWTRQWCLFQNSGKTWCCVLPCTFP